ncbi:MAG: hypothetical protein U0872_05750 [Planctomycetaceae bacterium]
MTPRNNSRFPVSALIITLSLGCCGLLAGCGGGASAATTVKYLPSRPESVAASEAPAGAPAGGATATEAVAGGFGTLKGKIVYGGSFSPLPPLYAKGNAPKDPEVCGAEAAPNQRLIVNDGGLANVFIYLDKIPKGVKVPPAPADPAVFDQKFCVFKPHALLMRSGQTVKVLNSDPVLHNTHTKPERNNEFNGSVDQAGAQFVYTRPEKKPVSVVCDIHPWMTAYHLPIDHPWAAVSGDDGTFEIADVPSGKLEFKLWHEAGQEIEKAYKVDIKPGETTTVEITVPASKLSP